MCGFSFCTDITQYLNKPNVKLERAIHLTNEMFANMSNGM